MKDVKLLMLERKEYFISFIKNCDCISFVNEFLEPVIYNKPLNFPLPFVTEPAYQCLLEGYELLDIPELIRYRNKYTEYLLNHYSDCVRVKNKNQSLFLLLTAFSLIKPTNRKVNILTNNFCKGHLRNKLYENISLHEYLLSVLCNSHQIDELIVRDYLIDKFDESGNLNPTIALRFLFKHYFIEEYWIYFRKTLQSQIVNREFYLVDSLFEYCINNADYKIMFDWVNLHIGENGVTHKVFEAINFRLAQRNIDFNKQKYAQLTKLMLNLNKPAPTLFLVQLIKCFSTEIELCNKASGEHYQLEESTLTIFNILSSFIFPDVDSDPKFYYVIDESENKKHARFTLNELYILHHKPELEDIALSYDIPALSDLFFTKLDVLELRLLYILQNVRFDSQELIQHKTVEPRRALSQTTFTGDQK